MEKFLIAKYILKNRYDDLFELNKFVSKGILKRVQNICKMTFHKCTYNDAIEILQKEKFTEPVIMGNDLSSEMENYLTYHFKGPVFITHWPCEIKSFYMKEYKDGLCECFDLLMPYHIGELIGGSMREDDYDKLISKMELKQIPQEPLKFYTDLRKFGTAPHGGFGLGFERLVLLSTGIKNIRDVIPYPRYPKHCKY